MCIYTRACFSFSAEFRAGPSFLKVDVSISNVTVKDKTNNTHPPSQKIHKGPTMYIHLRTPFTKKAVVCLYHPPQIFFFIIIYLFPIRIVFVELRKRKHGHHIISTNCSYLECWVVFLYKQLQHNFKFTDCILAICLEVKWHTSKIHGFNNCTNKLVL